jgi:hypothetical protein
MGVGRSGCTEAAQAAPSQWCGPGRDRSSDEVEVDETYVGARKDVSATGQTDKKAIVAIAIEIHEPRGFGRVRLQRYPMGPRRVSCPSCARRSSPARRCTPMAEAAITRCPNGGTLASARSSRQPAIPTRTSRCPQCIESHRY